MSNEPMQKTATSGAAQHEIHLLELLVVFARRWRFIALFTVAVAVLTTIAVFVIPSKYTAFAVVMPPSQTSSASALLSQIGGASSLASAAGASLAIKNPAEVYVSLFRSRTVEDAMVQQFNLMDRYHKKKQSDAREAFEKHSTVDAGAKDGLITLSVTDKDAQMAAKMANAYIDAYQKLSATLAITEASQRRVFFQQQMLEANESLIIAEEALKGMEQKQGVVQIDAQTRALIESAAALRGQVVAKEVQIQGMRAYATQDNPAMLQATRELSALQGQLAKLTGGDQDSGSSESGMLLAKGKIPETGLDLVRKMRDVKYYTTISDMMEKQFEAAKLDEARQGTSVQIIDPAVTPDKRSFPKITITILAGTALGFFAACVWCLMVEGFAKLKSHPDEGPRLQALLNALKR